MSHREMDHASDIRARLAALDGDIAAAKASGVVDMRAFAEMRRQRASYETQLTELEIEKTWP